MNKFQQTTPPTAPVSHTQTNQPYSDRSFLHTYLAGALLPLVQATITAFMAGIGTLALLYMVDAIDYIKPILIVFALVWVLTWLYLQRRWVNLTALENMLKLDINGDGQIGKPVEKVETVIRLEEVKDNGHFQSHTYKLPITDDQLIRLADGLLHRGRTWARREWTPKANGFSDDEWRELQSAMLRFQLLEPMGAGFRLTRPGAAMIRYYASLSPTQTEVSNAE
jgi:hypothetical protein